MIVGSGWARGARLSTPPGEATRPTSAKVRAAVLNMLSAHLEDALVLDLCAGSGALGLEAVSRGARGAVLVESGRAALKCLRVNVAEVERRATAQGLEVPLLVVVEADVAKAVAEPRRLEAAVDAPFDLVIMDPPYAQALALGKAVLGPLASLAADEAMFVLETAAADGAGAAALSAGTGWEVMRQRAYGDTMITIFGRDD